jgi:pimeloyl-ACP methyl ester carboxylesterase
MASRSEIIAAYLEGGAIQTARPESVDWSYTDGQAGLHPSDVSHAHSLRFHLGGGVWNVVDVLYPASGDTTSALICVSGHESDPTMNWLTISEALSRGHTVAEIYMVGYKATAAPHLQGFPTYYLAGSGPSILLTTHDDMEMIDTVGGAVLSMHLEPVFRTAAWLRARGYGKIGVVGHSGGGWTALMAAALDTSLDFCCSINGWCPIGATGEPTRDYEQTGPWYDTTGYLDYAEMIGARPNLSILGADDPVFGPAALGQSTPDSFIKCRCRRCLKTCRGIPSGTRTCSFRRRNDGTGCD